LDILEYHLSGEALTVYHAVHCQSKLGRMAEDDDMTHAILSLGWFDTSFESLIKGTDEPARIAQTQRVTPDINGVVFYYMQVPHGEGEEQFVAVRVQFRGRDIRCHSPVRIDKIRHAGGIKAFGPNVQKIYDDNCASELLWDLAIRNPLQFSELHAIAKEIGLASKKPWDKGRDRLIP
jgi:hypothetical protein